jgi:prepilin peptidase CpaA
MNLSGDLPNWLHGLGYLFWPLLFSLWVAIGDVRTRRIPNYLTFIIALSGFGYQVGLSGWHGAAQSAMGLGLGFGLLIIPYLLSGMGAGDVKALAALGAWLGPQHTLFLFFYMAVAGGLISLAILCWNGQLWIKIRRGWIILVNWILQRPFQTGGSGRKIGNISVETKTIPYGVAIALGMTALYWRVPVL